MDSLVTSQNPPDSPDSADDVDTGRLLLTAEQAELIETFRKDIRIRKTDADKLQLCEEMRNQLLKQYTQVELLAALFDRVMLAECPDYKKYKKNQKDSKKKTTTAEKTQSNMEEWDRFIGIAASGSDTINRCLPSLKAASRYWGQEKVRYYNWPGRGVRFCVRLGAIAGKMEWSELVIKGNRLLLRRAEMGGRSGRRLVRDFDPLDLVELENLAKWTGKGPYVKDKDPNQVALPFKGPSVRDLPAGYSFDKFGLIVRRQPESPTTASPMDSDLDRAMEAVVDVVLATAANEHSEDTSSIESPGDIARVPTSSDSQSSTPLSSPPESPAAAVPFTTKVLSENVTRGPANIVPSGDADNRDPPGEASRRILRSAKLCPGDPGGGTAEIAKDVNYRHATNAPSTVQLRRRNDKLDYHEPPQRKPVNGRPKSLNTAGQQKRCCPSGIPPMVLAFLDQWDGRATRPILPTFKLADVSLKDMCYEHLKKFVEAVTSSESFESPLMAEKDLQTASSGGVNTRRRRASLSDIESTATKRSRLIDPDASVRGPLLARQDAEHDLIRDEAYRERMLGELESTEHTPGSWGEQTNKLVCRILSKSRPPMNDEAFFLGGEEAAQSVEMGSIDAPIFTHGQQRFEWKGQDRPISQFFYHMEDLGLDRTVSVQVPSRGSRETSLECRTLREIRDRFFSQQPTQDPWNLLDLQSLLPSTLPSFLEGKNCQLLLRVRDIILMDGNTERSAPSGGGWNEWRNAMEWALLAEGGHNTAPHMHIHGYSSWITAQEGDIGFGWMSRPSQQEQDAWMSNPHSYTGGEWRYTILSPGHTVFFPSGTIHFVFRIRGKQTFGLSGHILQWSGIERWLTVVIAQMKKSEITNEHMASSAPRLVRVVKQLVANRSQAGRVEQMGGREAVARFYDLVKEFDDVTKGLRTALVS